MKFNCGLTWDQKEVLRQQRREAHLQYIRSWHPAFAWFPKRVGNNQCVWLESYERRWVTIHNPNYSCHYTCHEPQYLYLWENRELHHVVSPVTE